MPQDQQQHTLQQMGLYLSPLGEAPETHELLLPAFDSALYAKGAVDLTQLYGQHLPSASAAPALAPAVVPASTKLGDCPLVLIYDRRCAGQPNDQAELLTTGLERPGQSRICGGALLLFAEPGRDLSTEYMLVMADMIRNKLLPHFSRTGKSPTAAEWAQMSRTMALNLEYI